MRAALGLVLLLALAGCAQPEPHAEVQLPASDTVLRGVVVDAAITPLGNVTVTVDEAGATRSTNTSVDGTWEFRGISPGSHLLGATRTGYLPLQLRVDVQPDVVSEAVKLVLEPDASYRKPHVVAFEFRGQIECGAVASAPPPVGFVALAVCQLPNDLTGTQVTNDQFLAVHALDGGTPTHVQSELVWDATSELGRQFLFYLDEVNRTGAGSATGAPYTELERTTGPSPLMASLGPGEMDRLGFGYDLQVRVFSWASEPLPVGATFEQPFQVYTHVFYGFAPPPGWRFTVDGAVEPPA